MRCGYLRPCNRVNQAFHGREEEGLTCRKVTNTRQDPLVKRTPERQVTTEAHPSRPYPPITPLLVNQEIDDLLRVAIVGREQLVYLVGIPGVCTNGVVRDRERASEFVVDAGAGDDVALRSDHLSEPQDGSRHLSRHGRQPSIIVHLERKYAPGRSHSRRRLPESERWGTLQSCSHRFVSARPGRNESSRVTWA